MGVVSIRFIIKFILEEKMFNCNFFPKISKTTNWWWLPICSLNFALKDNEKMSKQMNDMPLSREIKL